MGGLGLAAAAPLVLGAARAFANSRLSAAIPAVDAPPICHVAETLADFRAPGDTPHALKLSFNANSICTVGVPAADKTGIFARHNLKVELVNFGGSTDQLLEAIATGRADAGVGMALRWLKPLEQGFDVKFTAAIHGGCIRLLALKEAGLTGVADLRGKTVGVSDMAAPDKNYFSIVAAKLGLNPITDITWKQYPADLLSTALRKGEVQAISLGDPLASLARDRGGLAEVANNLSGEYAQRACCVLGVRGSLVRNERPVAAALTAALLESQEWVATHPDEAGEIFAAYTPNVKPAELAAMLRSHTHHHHPTGAALQSEIAAYVQEMKGVSIIKPSTDPARLASRVCVDVLA
jgi:NitT/TauT family transport system substrate-binding protein